MGWASYSRLHAAKRCSRSRSVLTPHPEHVAGRLVRRRIGPRARVGADAGVGQDAEAAEVGDVPLGDLGIM